MSDKQPKKDPLIVSLPNPLDYFVNCSPEEGQRRIAENSRKLQEAIKKYGVRRSK